MSGLISGAGQLGLAVQQGNDQENASRMQLDRETQQANLAINQAQQQSAFQTGKTRIQGTELAGEQKAAYADSGVDATTGTAAQVQSNTAALNELDAQQQAINAAKEVWGYQQARKQARQEYVNRASNANTQEAGQILGGSAKYIGGVASLAAGGGG